MRVLEKVIDCPPSCARLQIKAHWRNKRRKDGIEKVRSIYPLHPTFLCTTFLTILAGTNFDHLSSLLFSSGILRQLCSHKMYLRYFRFKGHEQIEETLVANEDKHGAGGGKSCTNGEFKVGFSLSYREDQIPRNFVNKSRIVETLGREQILSVPCMVGRGGG